MLGTNNGTLYHFVESTQTWEIITGGTFAHVSLSDGNNIYAVTTDGNVVYSSGLTTESGQPQPWSAPLNSSMHFFTRIAVADGFIFGLTASQGLSVAGLYSFNHSTGEWTQDMGAPSLSEIRMGGGYIISTGTWLSPYLSKAWIVN